MNESVQEITLTPNAVLPDSSISRTATGSTPGRPFSYGKENGPNVLCKLLKVMEENEYIQKLGKHPTGFNFVRESDIKRKIGASFVKHGLVFVPGNATAVNEEIVRTGKNGERRESLTTVVLSFKILDTDTGEYVQGQMPGQGVDGGDKGVYKAITGAIKYILTSTFLIETGDDPENEPDPPKDEKPVAKPAPPPAKVESPKVLPPTAIPGVVTGAAISEPKIAAKKEEIKDPPVDDLKADMSPLPTKEERAAHNARIIAFAREIDVTNEQIGMFLKSKLALKTKDSKAPFDATKTLTQAYNTISNSFLTVVFDKYLKPEFAEEIKKAV